MPQSTRQTKQSRTASDSPVRGRDSSELSASEAALDYFSEYARERPEVVAMWAFGLGFVLGWKLRIF